MTAENGWTNKRQKMKEIQRRYRDKKKEKEAQQEQQIQQLTQQLEQVEKERDRLQARNIQLDHFARLSLSQGVPPVKDEDEEGFCHALLASYANQVNSISRQFMTAEDVRGVAMRDYDQQVEQAYVRQLAELLLKVDSPGGLEALEDYVIGCRAAGARALKHLPLKIYSKLEKLSSNFADSEAQIKPMLEVMRLDSAQELALVQACHVFHAEREQIWAQRRTITAQLQAPELCQIPLGGAELRDSDRTATDAVLQAAEALRANILREKEAVFNWYFEAMHVLSPLQEARGHMAAAPLSFSPWYLARYLDRSRAGWESLLLHEEWSQEPRSLEDLDVLLPGGDPLMAAIDV